MTPTRVVLWCFVYNFAATGAIPAIWLAIGTFTPLLIRCCLTFIMSPAIFSSALQTGKEGFVRISAVFTSRVGANYVLPKARSRKPQDWFEVALASSALSCRFGYLAAPSWLSHHKEFAGAFSFHDWCTLSFHLKQFIFEIVSCRCCWNGGRSFHC